ncbi:Aste57867_21007 [Aphanomyces stellatus]|uniref:Aste57867_21007 protein n=1 Tax=Aphanomyces stellatus TaxID=120398 RepID=A0A485LIH7_9STRA|nr:hypothetical protein As57867_020939 [Aphanomyces stellatus]VFT97682.1 Aste57867_21007 [Aphanomyces stellatus]
MTKTQRRPASIPSKHTASRPASRYKDPSHGPILPNLKLSVATMAIQRDINIMLDIDPTSHEPGSTIQTSFRLPKTPGSSSTKVNQSQGGERISITLPSPHRYTPRAETRQAIQTFHNLFLDARPRRGSKSVPKPTKTSDLELDVDDDDDTRSTAAVPEAEEGAIMHVADMLTDSDGTPLSIPKTPRYNGWNIKDVKNNYGWGGKVRFMAHVRRTKQEAQTASTGSPEPAIAPQPTKVDAADMEQVNVDNMKCTDKYIATCLKMELTPEPFIIPKREACAIDLSYYGTGSKPMDALSSCLASIPKLQTLVVKENRLSDVAIVHILESSDFTRLLTLNLSRNRIRDQSTRALHTFLNHNRIVQTLVLSDCDLHSDFIKCIEEPLAKNASLTHLDVSKNKLDDYCADALAIICKDNSNLTALDLSWNSLRGKAAAGLADALESNQCLQTLHLGWNGVGHGDGAHRIAQALRNNGYLQKLDVTANSIATEAVLALTNTWAESTVLEILVLDQNPIGTEGMRSVFRAYSNPLTKTQGRTILFDECSLHHNVPVFDPYRAGSGSHQVIDLDDPKTFWQALEILRLVNLYPSACQMDSVVLTTPLEAKHLQFHRLAPANQVVSAETCSTPPPLALVNHSEPWQVPLTGTLSFDFRFKPTSPQAHEIIPDAVTVFWDMYSTLEFDTDRVKYIKMFLEDHYINANQARHFLTTVTSIECHTDLIHTLLQKVSDTENLLSNTTYPLLPSKHQSFLNECAGKLLFFDSNLPNGRYALDLALPTDQRIAATLFRLSGDDKLRNKQLDGVNTSQKGNWECFRNETMDGEAYNLSRTVGIPDAGVFAFDFVVTTRLPKGTAVLAAKQFDQLCQDVAFTKPLVATATPAMVRSKSTKKKLTKSPSKPTLAPHDYETRKTTMKRTIAMGHVGLTSDQVVVLANCFEDIDHGRVDCVVTMLNHVVDLEDLFAALRSTTSSWVPSELDELVRRVGWLNIWNPAHAEMEYTLNLTVWEDHQMALILALLGDTEPGENWVDETYNNIFGWELPLSWVQGKIPHAGHLFLRYTTGPNNKYRVMSAREELKKRTLSGKHVRHVDVGAKTPELRPPNVGRRKSIHQVAL